MEFSYLDLTDILQMHSFSRECLKIKEKVCVCVCVCVYVCIGKS
jgi:hypothetical protein